MAEQNNEVTRDSGSEQGSSVEETINSARNNAPENLATTTHEPTVLSGSPASSPRLDLLPIEILTNICAHVEFSKANFLNLNLVCKRIRKAANLKDDISLHKNIARVQYPAVAVYLGDSQYNLDKTGELSKIHNQADEILCRVRSSMSNSELQAEKPDWEDDFYFCLLLLQFIGSLRLAPNYQLGSDERIEQLWSLQTKLCVRHVFSRIAEAIVRTLNTTGRHMSCHYFAQVNNAGHIARSLERYVDVGLELESILDILDFASGSSPTQILRQQGACGMLSHHAIRAGSLTASMEWCMPWAAAPSPDFFTLEHWLLTRLVSSNLPPSLSFWLFRSQEILRHLLTQFALSSGHPPKLCDYIIAHNPRANIPPPGTSNFQDAFDQAGNDNASVQMLFNAATQTGSFRYRAVSMFDWDAAIHLEMLNGNSALRRSMSTGWAALDNAVTGWRGQGWVKPVLR